MTRPGWQDFGTHDESAYPELWSGVIGAWAPCLGPTGSRLHDMSRRSNWGTLTNMTPSTAWQMRNGVYSISKPTVDHTSFVDCGDMQSASLAYPFSMSCWIYNASVSPDGSPLSKARNTDGYAGAMIWIDGSVAKAYWSSGVRASGATPITSRTTWVQVGICWTGSQAQVWVNGRLDGTGNTIVAPNAAATSLNIGRYGDTAGRGMSGDVNDAFVWSRCLSAAEWAHLHAIGIGGMYQRRRRRSIYLPQAGFQAAWALRRSQIIGGGLR